MSNRVVHFEIPSDEPAKCAAFLKDVFGWEIKPFRDDYLLLISGDEKEPGINGAVMKRVGQGQPLINTISVDDIDETCKQVELAGGKLAKPKFAVPDVGWLAFFADPDGNMHGVMQNDKSAK